MGALIISIGAPCPEHIAGYPCVDAGTRERALLSMLGRPARRAVNCLNRAPAPLNLARAAVVIRCVRRYVVAAAGAVFVLLAACSSSSTGSKTTAQASPSAPAAASSAASHSGTAAATGGIVISGFAYSGTLTVKPGQKVTVTNKDSVAHTLTDKKTHLFNTGNIAADGGTGTFTAPVKPGRYPFGCSYHPEMAGTLIVKS